jgi:hypothetical protein
MGHKRFLDSADSYSGDSELNLSPERAIQNTVLVTFLRKFSTNIILISVAENFREIGHLCVLMVRVPGYRSRGPGSILGATRFFRCSVSGTRPTQPREYNRGANWKKK